MMKVKSYSDAKGILRDPVAKDVKVYGEYIYVAEGSAGLGIYKYNGANLDEVGRIVDEGSNAYISSVSALDDGSFALLQAGGNGSRYRLVNCRDKEKLHFMSDPATDALWGARYRSLSIGQVGNRLAVFGNRISWFSWLNDGEANDSVQYHRDESGLGTQEWAGMASIGGECIITTDKGYKIYNPETAVVSDEIVIDDGYAKGKCAVYGNYLVITRMREGKVIVLDITDPKNPVTVKKTDTSCVTDVPCIVGDTMYVPCRHDGLLKVELK